MASIYKKEILTIDIPASEIIKKCRFLVGGTGGESDVTGYYTDDKPEKYQRIRNFIEVPDLEWYVDSEKVKIYSRNMISYVYPYKDKYVNKMATFKQLSKKFSEQNIRIPAMFFSGETGRYLKFNNDNALSKEFKELMYEGVSNLVVERHSNCFYVYPELKKDFFKKLAITLNSIPVVNDANNYIKFKHLLSWFVKQLNINNDLEQGTKTQGKGYDGGALQQKYIEWREYTGFTLDCTIQSGYMKTSSKVNYIHKSNSGINIRPYFDKATREIKYLYIDLYNNVDPLSENISILLEKEYKIDNLSLFDDLEPNDYILELFDDFKYVIETLSPNDDNSFEEYSKDMFLEEAFMDSAKYDNLVQLLKYKKNIILQGAPGVGKTFLATKLAYSMIGSQNRKQVEVIQFHQSYSYEDFIMGFKPEGNGFELKNGIFYTFCKNAEKEPQNDYFFIIDEINRGNLSKIFGELLMLVEGDKRGHEHSIKLAYKDELFYVPKNVYIIGMMNTADRSLGLMDYALRRRFSFYEIDPAFENAKFKEYISKYIEDEEIVKKIVDNIKELNDYISNADNSGLGKGFRIGHSYFCVPPVAGQSEKEWYKSIITFEVLPLLEEYWWDEKAKVDTWKNKLLGE